VPDGGGVGAVVTVVVLVGAALAVRVPALLGDAPAPWSPAPQALAVHSTTAANRAVGSGARFGNGARVGTGVARTAL